MYLSDPDKQIAPKTGLILLQVLVLCMFFVFALRFWYLQVHKSAQFVEMARENQKREKTIFAPRGEIRDRNGILVAINEPGYALTLVREDVDDMKATLNQVSLWTGIPIEELETRVKEKGEMVKRHQRLVLVKDISLELVAQIEANSVFWPGLEIEVQPRRLYREGKYLSHILGYVAVANKKELKKYSVLQSGDYVGRQGLELVLEDRLRGTKGLRQLDVDATTRILKSRTLRQPRSGEDVRLSIDFELQKYCSKLLEGQAGGIVVLEPYSGQLLALVTQPTYDNNFFTTGMSTQRWQALTQHPRNPLLNRVIQSVHPPGSVWKLMMAAAGLHYNVISPHTRVFCSGSYKLGNRVFRCWKKGGHGSVDLQHALVQSCDVYFYQLGEKLGVTRIHEYAVGCGFGVRTGIDLPHEKTGVAPSKEWKKKRFNASWAGGDTVNMAIGQGYTLAQPLQVARFLGALVNGGELLKPSLLADVEPEVQGHLELSEQAREIILESMVETVKTGTAKRIFREDARIGGKTGTAQVVKARKNRRKTHEMPYDHRDHAWLATWGEKDGKTYVVIVLIEHGGHGGSASGPIAKAVYEYLFGPQPTQAEKTKKTTG